MNAADANASSSRYVQSVEWAAAPRLMWTNSAGNELRSVLHRIVAARFASPPEAKAAPILHGLQMTVGYSTIKFCDAFKVAGWPVTRARMAKDALGRQSALPAPTARPLDGNWHSKPWRQRCGPPTRSRLRRRLRREERPERPNARIGNGWPHSLANQHAKANATENGNNQGLR